MFAGMKKGAQKKKHQTPPLSPSSQGKKKTGSPSSFSNFLEGNALYLVLLSVVVIAVSVVRSRFVGMPLERDEGEYAYFGQLILDGVAPYSEAYNMKLPGIYYMYALIMAVFGESYKGIHTGLLIMNAGTMILLFYALKRFYNPMTGLLTAGFYGVMALSFNLLAFAAHATHFAVFYLALSLFFFSQYEDKKSILFACLTGAMLGMSFLMKQQAVYFILFGGIVFTIFHFLEKPVRWKDGIIKISAFSFSVFIPYLLVVLVMVAAGTFDKFWFWTVQYASKYASGLPWASGKDLLDMTFAPIWEEHWWVWAFAIVGSVIVFVAKYTVKQKIFAIALFIFAALATTPGFYFRQHYFIVVLPATALLAALAIEFPSRWIGERINIKLIGSVVPLIALFAISRSIVSNEKTKFYYTAEDPVWLCKAIYGTNPFVESLEIAKYIKENSSDTDKVAVLGSEPQIPFYAGRRSATGHIYTYGLMEIHEYNLKMQEEMIAEIEKNKPKFLVFCNVPFSWLSKPDSPMKIFEWYNTYSAAHYEPVGLVDIPDRGPSSIYWNADAKRNPVNKNCVWVFKRKETVIGG